MFLLMTGRVSDTQYKLLKVSAQYDLQEVCMTKDELRACVAEGTIVHGFDGEDCTFYESLEAFLETKNFEFSLFAPDTLRKFRVAHCGMGRLTPYISGTSQVSMHSCMQFGNYITEIGGVLEIPDYCTEVTASSGYDKLRMFVSELRMPDSVDSLSVALCRQFITLNKVRLSAALRVLPAETFAECRELESIELPTCLNNLGDSCFEACHKLSDAELPKGLARLGAKAFRATGLTHATIPENITFIGADTFAECNQLTEVIFPPYCVTTIDSRAFKNTGITELNLPVGLSSIGAETFAGIPIKTLDLPASIQVLGESVFDKCNLLKEVVIRFGDLEERDVAPFTGCSSLERVSIQGDMHRIPQNFFSECEWLSYIHLPECIQTVGAYACLKLKHLVQVDNLDKVSVIEHKAFVRCGFTELILGEVILHSAAFRICRDLRSLQIANCRMLENEVFEDCKNLETAQIQGTLECIGDSCFKGCRSLKEFVIPDSVKTLESECFYACRSLCKIVLSEQLCVVGDNCFGACDSLREVVVPDNVPIEALEQFFTGKFPDLVLYVRKGSAIDERLQHRAEWCKRIGKTLNIRGIEYIG